MAYRYSSPHDAHFHTVPLPHMAFLLSTSRDNVLDALDRDLAAILHKYLSTGNNCGATPSLLSDTIDDLQAYYENAYLSADPLLEHEDDKGVGSFLAALYTLMMDTAKLAHYDLMDSHMLVCLVEAVQTVDAFTRKIWNVSYWFPNKTRPKLASRKHRLIRRQEDRMSYDKEPLFASHIDDAWNGIAISKDDIPDGLSDEELQTACQEYINFSPFLARSISSGLPNKQENRTSYSVHSLREGLALGGSIGIIRDCLIVVAAQHILLAGDTIYEDVVKSEQILADATATWKKWANDFAERAQEYMNHDGAWPISLLAQECAQYMYEIQNKVEYWKVEKSNIL